MDQYQKYDGYQKLNIVETESPIPTDGLRNQAAYLNDTLNTIIDRLSDHLVSIRGSRPEPASGQMGNAQSMAPGVVAQLHYANDKVAAISAMLCELEGLI